MADYPSRVVPGGLLIPSLSKNVSFTVNNPALNYAARFSSNSRVVNSPLNISVRLNARGQLLNASPLLNVQSLAKLYFNNGFSQDSANIYLSKSSLGLPNGLNLSLEAFFVACLLQWAINLKNGDDQKITSQYLAYADKQGSYVYFTIEVVFKKQLSLVDEYELQPVFTITPLDF